MANRGSMNYQSILYTLSFSFGVVVCLVVFLSFIKASSE